MERALKIKSVGNARQLGGYSIGSSVIKQGVLLRTASLAGLSEEDREILQKEYRLARIVDLRMSFEREQVPDPQIAGAENYFLPVMEIEDYPNLIPEKMEALLDPRADRFEMMKSAAETGLLDEKFYVEFLFSKRGLAAYRAFFELLLELPEGRSILWHCTDGKDRTCVAAMLVLTALGADRETIMADYLLTNEFNRARLEKARIRLEEQTLAPRLREIALFGFGAVFDYYMTNAFCAMEERCGSPEGYLARMLGVGESERALLRHRFLEE